MQLKEIWEIASALITSVGVSSAIMWFFSDWLAKVWANRIAEKDRVKYEKEIESYKAALNEQLESFRAKSEESLKRIDHELDFLKNITLTARQDKIKAYYMGIDAITEFLIDFTHYRVRIQALVSQGKQVNFSNDNIMGPFKNFDLQRSRVQAYIGLYASQSVMDAYDELIDHILKEMDKFYRGIFEENYWPKIREKVYKLLNELRKDIGINSSPIIYNGDL